MIIEITKDLAAALKRAERIAEKKATIKALECVRITQDLESVEVCTTNLSITYREQIGLMDLGDDCAVITPVAPLNKLIRAAKKQACNIGIEEDKAYFLAGENRIELETYPAENFPELPGEIDVVNAASIPRSVDLDWVLRAMSSDKTEKYLMCLAVDNHCLVATDGHRLHKVIYNGLHGKTDKAICIPRELFGRMPKSKDDHLVFSFGEDKSVVCSEGWEIFFSALETGFPPYGQVIPEDWTVETTISAEQVAKIEAAAEFKRAATGASKKDEVALKFRMPSGDGEPFELDNANPDIAFNARYLLDAVSPGDKLKFKIYDSETSYYVILRIDSGGRTAVVMPIRL